MAVEEMAGGGQQPCGALCLGQSSFQLQQQLGPFGEVADLVAPGAEDVGVVVPVVVPVDRPVAAIVLPDEAAGQRGLALGDVLGERDGARQEGFVAGGFMRREHRLATVHVGILAAVAADLPVR